VCRRQPRTMAASSINSTWFKRKKGTGPYKSRSRAGADGFERACRKLGFNRHDATPPPSTPAVFLPAAANRRSAGLGLRPYELTN